jgi:hypothetical protein
VLVQLGTVSAQLSALEPGWGSIGTFGTVTLFAGALRCLLCNLG